MQVRRFVGKNEDYSKVIDKIAELSGVSNCLVFCPLDMTSPPYLRVFPQSKLCLACEHVW